MDTSEDGSLEADVDRFLDRAADAFSEYDEGYADADATVRVLRTHVWDLRDGRQRH